MLYISPMMAEDSWTVPNVGTSIPDMIIGALSGHEWFERDHIWLNDQSKEHDAKVVLFFLTVVRFITEKDLSLNNQVNSDVAVVVYWKNRNAGLDHVLSSWTDEGSRQEGKETFMGNHKYSSPEDQPRSAVQPDQESRWKAENIKINSSSLPISTSIWLWNYNLKEFADDFTQ